MIYVLILTTNMVTLVVSNDSKSYVSGFSQFNQKPFFLTFCDHIHVDWNLRALQIFSDFACCNEQHFSVGVHVCLCMCTENCNALLLQLLQARKAANYIPVLCHHKGVPGVRVVRMDPLLQNLL